MAESVAVQMVTDDPNSNEMVLYFVEDGPWPNDPSELRDLLKRIQDEILDAVDASVQGGVAKVYPDSVGKKIRIQIDSPSGCPETLENLVYRINEFLLESEEHRTLIRNSKFISGIRVVTGHMLGRFKNPSNDNDGKRTLE